LILPTNKKRQGITISVSKNTDYVLVGEDPGSKADRAKEIMLTIIDEAKLKSML